jgi:ElaB/YqjD/DUF883 family membrane-anchored ribosome-binding protein
MNVLMGDVVKLYDDLSRISRSQALAARDKVATMANARLEGLERSADLLRNRGQIALDKMRMRLEEYPITSILIALGTGFVAGRILRRR